MKNLTVLYFIALIVGIFQLPLVENKLNENDIYMGINESFPLARDLQQKVENTKISMVASLDSFSFKNFYNKQVAVISPVKTNNSPETITDTLSTTNPTFQSNIPIQENNENSAISSIKNNYIAQNTVIEKNEIIERDNSLLVEEDNLENNTDLIVPVMEESNIEIEEESEANNYNDNKITYCSTQCKILLIGDSVMGDVYYSLSRHLKSINSDWTVINAHKVSSGLSNTDYYDWITVSSQLLKQYNPDYVISLMGTNDAQNISFNGKPIKFGTEKWKEIYKNRMSTMKEQLDSTTQYWLWLGLPVVKSPGFNKRLQEVRNIQQLIAQKHYISNEKEFGIDNEPNTINIVLRAKDGIHLNSKGADVMAKFAFKTLLERTHNN